jgi:uncharacterized membrane protein YkoI
MHEGAAMNRKTGLIIGAGAIAIAALTGTGIAIAGGDSGTDNEAPITGTDLDQASAAALEHTGEGTVTETEVGDEESTYEVEVTLDDGSQVDVQLDAQFNVVSQESDGVGEDEGPNDD